MSIQTRAADGGVWQQPGAALRRRQRRRIGMTPDKAPLAFRVFMLAWLVSLAVAGCKSEERIVSARGGLYGLPGAQSGVVDDTQASSKPEPTEHHRGGPWDSVLRAFPGYQPPADTSVSASAGAEPQSQGEMLGLRRTNRDGTVTLFSRSPSDVMYHVMTTLDKKEHDLLFDQVLAESTKAEYRRRGRDAWEAVEFLAKRRGDIAALFGTFPMGDQTPGVALESIGRNMFRLSAPVAMARELRLHSLDVVIEDGQFRLLMIR